MRDHIRLYVMGGLGEILQPGDVYGGLLNRALSDLWERYEWSYRTTNCIINTVAPKTNGTITVTQGSPTVIGTGTNFSLNDKGAFIWVGGVGITPLPIAAVSGPQLLTLSSPFAGPTLINTTYTLSPLYYLVPGAQEVMTVISDTVELQKRLMEEINAWDPSRQDVGGAPAIFWCPAPQSPNGDEQIELSPVPGDARAYLVWYRRRAPVMVNDRDIPLISSIVVEEAAMITACEMMFASTGRAQWITLRDKHQANLDGGGLNPPGGVLGEALTRDSSRKTYSGALQKPGPINRGYDSLFTPLHSAADE